MTRCRHCNRRIWPWQKTASWGVFGHTRATADHIAHLTCMRKRRTRNRTIEGEQSTDVFQTDGTLTQAQVEELKARFLAAQKTDSIRLLDDGGD